MVAQGKNQWSIKMVKYGLIFIIFLSLNIYSQSVTKIGSYADISINCLEVSDTLAFIGVYDTLKILQNKYPNQVKFISKVKLGTTNIMKIKRYGNYVYCSVGLSGIGVVDISDINNPIKVNQLNGLGYTRALWVADGYLYASCASEGIRIFEISNPQNPVEVGRYNRNANANDVKVRDTLAYVAYYVDGMRIVNIKDKTNPVEIGYYDSPGSTNEIDIEDTLAYLADGTQQLFLIGISDPTKPYFIKQANDGAYFSYNNISAHNRFATVIANFSRMNVFDCRNMELGPIRITYIEGAYISDIKMIGDTIYMVNHWGLFIFRLDRTTSIASDNTTFEFSLSQNYPNPFNSTTKIKYEIPTSPYTSHLNKGEDGRGSVTLKIYDILGREVETLVNEEQLPGIYNVEWNASRYTSGIYYYELTVSNGSEPFRKIKKMIYVK